MREKFDPKISSATEDEIKEDSFEGFLRSQFMDIVGLENIEKARYRERKKWQTNARKKANKAK